MKKKNTKNFQTCIIKKTHGTKRIPFFNQTRDTPYDTRTFLHGTGTDTPAINPLGRFGCKTLTHTHTHCQHSSSSRARVLFLSIIIKHDSVVPWNNARLLRRMTIIIYTCIAYGEHVPPCRRRSMYLLVTFGIASTAVHRNHSVTTFNRTVLFNIVSFSRLHPATG